MEKMTLAEKLKLPLTEQEKENVKNYEKERAKITQVSLQDRGWTLKV